MNFIDFKNAVAKQFDLMCKQPELFRTTASKDDMWDTYLASFPEGTNPIYRERTEHDCNCCKNFIRNVGNVIAIIDGRPVSIWDFATDIDPTYKTVARAMGALVTSKPIDNVFRHVERTAGHDKNFEDTIDGVKTWNHFFVNIPAKFVMSGKDMGPKLGDIRATHDVLLRGLKTITPEAIDTVLELIAQNSLYRGEEHKFAVNAFAALAEHHRTIALKSAVDYFVWDTIGRVSPAVTRIRNTSIGTLLVALSEGVDMEDAVKAFEAMVAPANYKRPTALVTKKMIDAAKTKLEELGLVSALERRYATINDITINNILFANRSARTSIEGDVFNELASKVTDKKPKSLDKVEEVTIEKFLVDILPKAESIELLVENRHAVNLVSLIAPTDPTALPMFKWDNRFSWSYNGEFADSIKERVKAAGGNVSGELCCRLAWEYTDDLDFHMHEPNGGHIYFSTRRQTSLNGGKLDVDANGGSGMMAHPVENIFYEKLSTMRDGIYSLKVNNYSRRSSTGRGFTVEIDILGTVHTINYEGVLGQSKTIEIAQLKKSKDGIEIISSLPSTQTSCQLWNIATQTYKPVNVVMMSPNYWDDQGVGNKHYFFMLDSCINEGKARGFFNEFLKPELTEHRKVIEMVGSKMLTIESDHQLSGLGFSSTQRNNVLCRVTGAFTRIINITF